jgi:predicted small lipoprotein YifL
MSRKTAALLVGVCVLGLAACEKKGPLERAGERVDHTADTIKNGGEEPTRDKLQDEADKARDKANDAAESARDHK